MKSRIHASAGALAMLTIAVFWVSTVISELSGQKDLIIAVKTAIPWGFLILIPALATVGATGFSLAGGRSGGLVSKKRRRMPLIAANGLLILVPSALYLADKARAGAFDPGFYTVQGVELVFGAINLYLLGLNFRDGLKMTAARGRARRRTSTPSS